MSSKQVVIYTDGNDRIGMGHVMRQLSIADGMRKLDKEIEIVFYLRSNGALDTVLQRGYNAVCLESEKCSSKEQLQVIRELLTEYEAICVSATSDPAPGYADNGKGLFLIDSYEVDSVFVAELQRILRDQKNGKYLLACMDDTMEVIYPADVVINYNLYSVDWDYPRHYQEYPDTKFFLGSNYAPLREQFQKAAVRKNEEIKEVQNVLFMSGGADPCHMTDAFLNRWIAENLAFKLTLLCGKFQPDMEQIKEKAGEHSITVLQNVSDMVSVLSGQDLVISAAGSSLYELCALGIPAITYTTADNQHFAAKAFSEKTGMVHGGNYEKEPEKTLDTIFSALRTYSEDVCRQDALGKLQQLSQKMHRICDGQGALHLAKALINQLEEA